MDIVLLFFSGSLHRTNVMATTTTTKIAPVHFRLTRKILRTMQAEHEIIHKILMNGAWLYC